MTISKTILLLFLTIGGLHAQTYSDRISVNFFLLDECPITQNITGEINYIFENYQDQSFEFVAYFPSEASTTERIDQFLEDYRLTLPHRTDYDQSQVERLGATVAPQVVVFDEINQRVLYRGRIDNSYANIGSRRRVVTSRDLRITLDAILNQVPIKTPETTAVGCFLQRSAP